MTASTSQRWIRSSKENPCPVCGRTKDGDCQASDDGLEVNCHHPRDLSKGAILQGADGRTWAFTHNTADSRAGHFTLHKPRTGKASGANVLPFRPRPEARQPAPPQPAPIPPEPPALARTVARPAAGSPYRYSETQRVVRTDNPDGSKKFRCEHLAGDRWAPGKGPDPWPAFNQAAAIGAQGWILETEGEKCVELPVAAGVVTISQPGHAHGVDQIRPRYEALLNGGAPGVVYLADNDAEGRKRANQAGDAAALAGLPIIILQAGDLWPGLPAAGSIDDAPGTAVEQIEVIGAAARVAHARMIEVPLAAEHLGEREQQELTKKQKGRRRLAPDEVLALLPERIGTPRLNIRTRAAHLPDRIISGNDAAHLYLELSNDEQLWGKEPTADVLALLAGRNTFDPAIEHLEAITASAEPLADDIWKRLDLLMFGITDLIAANYMPKYLIAAVARLYEPGCKVDQMPVLIGPQGIGKTEAGRALFSPGLFGDQLTARLDVDDVTRLHKFWATELAELDGITRRSDQESLKAFLTRPVDTERRKYGRDHEDMPRRSVFWGTSNGAPLRDLSGSRRFVCIALPHAPLPLDWITSNRAAIWARALMEYRNGSAWFSDRDEAAEIAERNLDHQQLDPWAERVGAFLESRKLAGVVKTGEVLEHLGVETAKQSNVIAGRVRQLVEAYGWTQRRGSPSPGMAKVQGFWPPV